jgi:TPR repeat protein
VLASGDPSRCNNLGVCYHKVQCGLAKDDARAAQLYQKACKGGDSSARHNLDVMKN